MTQTNILFIGMDVHKESIVITLADDDRSEVRRYGSIGGTMRDFKKTLRKLVSTGKDLFFCYEAGPCVTSYIDSLSLRDINASWLRLHLFLKKQGIK